MLMAELSPENTHYLLGKFIIIHDMKGSIISNMIGFCLTFKDMCS